MFILEHFWKFVLIIIVAVAGYFTWLRYDADQKQKFFAQNFANHFDPTVYTTRSDPEDFARAYLQAIATAKNVSEIETKEKDVNPVTQLVEDATEANGLSSAYGNAANRNIRNALKTCEEYGIFDDGGTNLELMEIGKPPIIQKGPYEGEPLVPAPLLNPLIAKEGLNQLLNTTLIPQAIRTMNAYSLTSKGVQASTAMKTSDIMTNDRSERVKRFYRTSRAKNVADIKAHF